MKAFCCSGPQGSKVTGLSPRVVDVEINDDFTGPYLQFDGEVLASGKFTTRSTQAKSPAVMPWACMVAKMSSIT